VDNVTHTLIGVGIANAFLRRRAGAAGAAVLAIASNLPDIDVLVHVTGDPAAVTLRRSFGHSLLLLPVWCLLLALLLRRFLPRFGLGTLVGMSLLGAATHVGFDLVNSFGVLLLWPLSSWRPEWAMVFIIDLVLFGLVALPPLLCAPRRMRRFLQPLSRAALACVVAYLGVCATGRALAARQLGEAATGGGTPAGAAPVSFAYVFPEPLGPHRWRGVARAGATYSLWLLRPFSGEARHAGDVVTRGEEPAVRAARASPLGRRLEGFFKAPVWETTAAGPAADGAGVCVSDLRFRSIVLDRGTAFRFCFRVAEDGAVERAGDRILARPAGNGEPDG
jgi:membrane-bound metal-dependent hydrolase YbcI (DUF457 family)